MVPGDPTARSQRHERLIDAALLFIIAVCTGGALITYQPALAVVQVVTLFVFLIRGDMYHNQKH